MSNDDLGYLISDSSDPKHVLFRALYGYDFEQVLVIGKRKDGTGIVLTSIDDTADLAMMNLWIQKMLFEKIGLY